MKKKIIGVQCSDVNIILPFQNLKWKIFCLKPTESKQNTKDRGNSIVVLDVKLELAVEELIHGRVLSRCWIADIELQGRSVQWYPMCLPLLIC